MVRRAAPECKPAKYPTFSQSTHVIVGRKTLFYLSEYVFADKTWKTWLKVKYWGQICRLTLELKKPFVEICNTVPTFQELPNFCGDTTFIGCWRMGCTKWHPQISALPFSVRSSFFTFSHWHCTAFSNFCWKFVRNHS